MDAAAPEALPNRALAGAFLVKQSLGQMTTKLTRRSHHTGTPPPSSARLSASLTESPYDLHEYLEQPELKRGTVLYLAYGSNLSNETFRGSRGIKPLSQVNVQVPSLRLTFDLPGLPYIEPCFANTGRRDPNNDPPTQHEPRGIIEEKTPLIAKGEQKDGYRKDKWHKGLIGVVYEVTPEDYAHIIATEGGGSSYQDILVECHPFISADPSEPVPQNPSLPPFKAHTLFAPAISPGEGPPKDGGRFQRPDTSYAQASARYLKLMTDGAAELDLPYEYQDYLHSLRPYTITTSRQRLGQMVFLATWVPIVVLIFGMGKMFADDKGRLPLWLREFTGAVFKAVWVSYDSFFKAIFGDGERTVTNGKDMSDEESAGFTANRTSSGWVGHAPKPDLEKSEQSDQFV